MRPRRLLAAAALVAASALLLAGCSASDLNEAGPPASSTSTFTTAASTPSPTTATDASAGSLGLLDPSTIPVDQQWAEDGTPVTARSVRGPAVLPELDHIAYAAGHTIRYRGHVITVPGSALVTGLRTISGGFLAALCSRSREHCQTYYGTATGRLVRLAGSGFDAYANPDGSLAVSSRGGSQAFLYRLPSGQRIGRSPLPPSPGRKDFRLIGFDGTGVLFGGREANSDDLVADRWRPGTDTWTEVSRRTDAQQDNGMTWQEELSEHTAYGWASPDGSLAFVNENNGGYASVRRLPSLKNAFPRFLVCRQCTFADVIWTSDHKVLFVEWPGQLTGPSHLATYGIRTRRLHISGSVPPVVVLDASREPKSPSLYGQPSG